MTENERQPFSEDAVLRELESLQRAIEESRARRKQANEAFDRFVQSFDKRTPPPATKSVAPAPPAAVPGPAAEPPRPIVAPLLPPVPLPSPAPPPAPVPAPEEPTRLLQPPHETVLVKPVAATPHQPLNWPPTDLPPHPEDFEESEQAQAQAEQTVPGLADPHGLDAWEHAEPKVATSTFHPESEIAKPVSDSAAAREPLAIPSALAAPPWRAARRAPPRLVVAALVLTFAAAYFVLGRDGGEEGSVEDAPTVAAPAVPPQGAPSPAPPAAAPPAVPPALAEVSTVRTAWVRITVDGQRLVERELPPDSRIPIQSGSRVVVRAGDAGAVRVAVRGQDQGPVGRDGQPATKTFALGPPK